MKKGWKAMKKNNLYLTKDLSEAAFLYANNLKFCGLKRELNYFWFMFEDKEQAESLSNRYWQRTATINAKEYSEAIRSLKDRLYARK